MDHLDLPELDDWNARREWFEAHIFEYEERASYLVGEQASALIFEVQSCFCVGAWAAVLILAFAVVEANLSETSGGGKSKRAVELLRDEGFEDDFTELRLRRNSLMHAKPENPAITIDHQYDDRDRLESDARQAVKLMFKAFYSQVGT
jgi:hypothetical protein